MILVEWFRQLGRALRNVARLSRRNPIWAITALTLSPIALIRHLFGVAMLFLIVGLVLGLGMPLILGKLLGLPRDSLIYQAVMMLTGLVVILVTLRALFQPLILRYGGPDSDDTHGSARFATANETRALARADTGLLIGRDMKTRKLLRYPGPAHLLTSAPTRTGKGVGTIIPNLIDYPGPVVCIDPKGENAIVTARERARFGPVHVLDPFGITALPSAVFNPLDRIDPAGLDLADDAMTLADALVYDAPGEAGEAHWNDEAKALIAGLILHIVASEPHPRHAARSSDARPASFRRAALRYARPWRPGRARRQSPPRQVRQGSLRRAVGRAAPYPFPR